jgi:GTP-binding protein
MIDSAEIKVKAGNGGDGIVSFIKVFYNPRGGPDGGNGGNGGDVIVMASERTKTLMEFKTKRLIIAKNGERGRKNYQYGKNGEDYIIKVPVGTVVRQVGETKETLLVDLTHNGGTHVLAKGGIGGLGNAHFKSSTNIKPQQFTQGKEGEEKQIKFELKLLSNVGLVGFPSVGKSTLLNSLANTNAKTASYHFTTLSPNLGVLKLADNKNLVLADLPGLIEGASKGKGLGEDFLRHAERCGVLIHVLDPTQTNEFMTFSTENRSINAQNLANNLYDNYQVIRKEMKNWSKLLVKKQEVIVINKVDITEVAEHVDNVTSIISEKTGQKVFAISAVTKQGVESLVKYLLQNYDNIITDSTTQLHKKQADENFLEINLSNIPNKRIKFKDASEILEDTSKI